MTDSELMRGLKKNNIDAYEKLIERYTAYIVAVVAKVGVGRIVEEELEELVSDVFIKLWNIRGQLEIQEGKEKAYIGVMARHQTLNYLKKKGLYEAIPLDEDTMGMSIKTPESELLEEEEKRMIEEVVRTLPEPDREIFIRRYFYSEKVVEIAAHLGLNVQTVGTKLHRGKQRLGKLLVERGIGL